MVFPELEKQPGYFLKNGRSVGKVDRAPGARTGATAYEEPKARFSGARGLGWLGAGDRIALQVPLERLDHQGLGE